MKKPLPRIGLLALCTLGLVACAQDAHRPLTDAPPPPDLLGATTTDTASQAPASSRTLRVIVQLKAPQQAADPAWLRALQDQAQAPVHYLAAVSGDTHVYAVQWPTQRTAAELLRRLGALPGVVHVESDSRSQAH